MSFYEPEKLCIGKRYKLTETVENQEVSSGNYFLVSVESCRTENSPVLGFSKSHKSKAEVFLVEAHAQFGDNAWRRAFGQSNHWEIYWPAGGIGWNQSSVRVEDI